MVKTSSQKDQQVRFLGSAFQQEPLSLSPEVHISNDQQHQHSLHFEGPYTKDISLPTLE
jgi:hypothetical protein